jgi:RND family efflux transporter MFP subunit
MLSYLRLYLIGPSLAVVISLGGCSKSDSSQQNAAGHGVSVELAISENRDVSQLEPVVGTVQAGLKSSVEAKINARVEKFLVSLGQNVNSGDLLIELDSRDLHNRADQTVMKRDQAARDFERLRKLKASNAVSEQQFEEAQTNAQVTKAAAEDAVTALSYAKILAPYKGVITKKLADAGDMTSPGKPLLEMEDPTALRLEIEVPEALITNLTLNSSIKVEIGSPAVAYSAKVIEISPTADPNSRTFLVKADLPSSNSIRSGLFGRAFISAGQKATVTVPRSAILKRGQLELAYVAQSGHAALRLVKTGRILNDDVEILSGLSAGEKVVRSPSQDLRDGSAIVEKQ